MNISKSLAYTLTVDGHEFETLRAALIQAQRSLYGSEIPPRTSVTYMLLEQMAAIT